jgi:hypothetical protein
MAIAKPTGRIAGTGKLSSGSQEGFNLAAALDGMNDRYQGSLSGWVNQLANDQFIRDEKAFKLQAQTQNWQNQSQASHQYGLQEAGKEGDFRRGFLAQSNPAHEGKQQDDKLRASFNLGEMSKQNDFSRQRDLMDHAASLSANSSGGGGSGGAGGRGGIGDDTNALMSDLARMSAQRAIQGDALATQRYLGELDEGNKRFSTMAALSQSNNFQYWR